MEHQRARQDRLARLSLSEMPKEKTKEREEVTMQEVVKALGFMALGVLISNVSWLHAWRMYKSGKQEGRGIRKAVQNGEQQSEPPYPPSVSINNIRRSK